MDMSIPFLWPEVLRIGFEDSAESLLVTDARASWSAFATDRLAALLEKSVSPFDLRANEMSTGLHGLWRRGQWEIHREAV